MTNRATSEGQPRELGFSPDRLARIARTMDAAVEARAIPGTVTIVARKGKVVHTHVTGRLDMERARRSVSTACSACTRRRSR